MNQVIPYSSSNDSVYVPVTERRFTLGMEYLF